MNYIKYEGEVKYDKPHGFGTLEFIDKKFVSEIGNYLFEEFSDDEYDFFVSSHRVIYKGLFEDGLFCGEGELQFDVDWDICTILFKGKFKGGKRNGHGQFLHRSYGGDTVFQGGEYEDDKLNGKGFIYTKWLDYEGEFKNAKYDGYGIEENRVTGQKYFGFFKEGFREGFGKLQFSDKKFYIGEFSKGYFNGHGTLISSNGEKYVGEFLKGERTGNGILIYADGRKRIAEFKNGIVDGMGIFISQQNEKFLGGYKNGERNGKGIFISSTGEEYVGEYNNGKRNGKGTLLLSNGTKYEGDFVDGKKEGYGVLSFANGEIYQGNFKANKYHGNGVLFKKKGDKIEGDFADGKFFTDKIGEKEIIDLSLHKRNNPNGLYLFIDTETTGLRKRHMSTGEVDDFNDEEKYLLLWPRLVRLSYIIQDSYGTEILFNDFIIKPDHFLIPMKASDIHGITTEIANKKGLPIKSVLRHFRQVYDYTRYIVGHNIYFDTKVIAAEFLRNDIQDTFTNKSKLDTMGLSVNYCAIPGNYSYKYPTLSELHQQLFNKPFQEAHSSNTDVRTVATCFCELKRRNIIQQDKYGFWQLKSA